MAASLAVPAEAMSGRRSLGDDRRATDHIVLGRGPAQEAIGEMASLLRDMRGSLVLGGSVLSAITIGISVEAAFSPPVLRPGVAPWVHLADTWTFIAAACFPASTAAVLSARERRGLPRRLSSMSGWLMVEAQPAATRSPAREAFTVI